MTKEKIKEYARTLALKYRLPYELLLKQIERESAFNPAALGRDGEIGLMQIMPATGASLGYSVISLRDPFTNIKAGSEYMAKNIKMITGLANWLPSKAVYRLALMAYNGGPGYVKKSIARAGPKSNLSEILSHLKYSGVKFSWVSSYANGVMGPMTYDEDLLGPPKKQGAGILLPLAMSLLLWYIRKQ